MKKIEANHISSEAKHSLKKRVITGLVMAAIAFPCIILGNWLYFGLIFVVTALAGYELVHITKIEGKLKIAMYILVIVFLVVLTNYIFFRNNWESLKVGGTITAWNLVTNGFDNLNLSAMIIIVIAMTFFMFSFFTEKITLFHVFYFTTMIIVLALGLQSFLYLRFSPFPVWRDFNFNYYDAASFPYFESLLLLLYTMIGVMMNDIGAYFVGMFFGKHKMNPRISPKKTWEGFVGGIAISAVCSIVFALVFALVGKPILPRFSLDQFYWVVLISISMPIAGDIGDFVFSAIKRNAGIKDFSNLLPGHGGILDRIDSLLFAGGSVAGLIAFMDFIQPLISNIGQ